VFVLEVMGRHAGWIAAAAGLAGEKEGDAPHVILFPEIPFDEAAFLARVKDSVTKHEYCVVVVSEGAHYADGRFLSEAGGKDAFGHAQLGGVAATIAQLVKSKLGFKYHYAIADYLQRAARHVASKVDVAQAYAMGKAEVANKEKMMPRNFISQDGFAITAACRKYLAPLIAGEDYPPYKNGLPSYVSLRNQRVTRRLKTEFVLK